MQGPSVLDYAEPPGTPAAARALWRATVVGAVLLLAGCLGGLAGRRMTPIVYQASTLCSVSAAGEPQVTPRVAQVEVTQSAYLSQMRSPAVLDRTVADLTAKGHSVPSGVAGRAVIDSSLLVSPIPDARLLSVRFEADQPQLAMDGTNAAMMQLVSLSVEGGTAEILQAPVLSSVRPIGGTLLGVVVGVLLALAGVRLWWWARRRARVLDE